MTAAKLDSYRAGQLNWRGQRPLLSAQLTRLYKTLGRWTVQGLDAAGSANHVCFGYVFVNNMNDAFAAEAAFHGFQIIAGDENNHFMGHEHLVAHFYKRGRVLSATVTLRVDVHSTTAEDYVVAWRFMSGTIANSAIPNPLPADNQYDDLAKGDIHWFKMRQNPGWDYRIFSGTQSGGSPYPSAGSIVINIPDVMRLGVKLNRGHVTSADPSARALTEVQDFEHELVDVNHLADFPKAAVWLEVSCQKVRGGLLVDNDVTVDVQCMQRIRVHRDTEGTLDDIPDTTGA